MNGPPDKRFVAELAVSAVVFGLGLAVALIGSGYPMGTASRMGPGYFPVLLGGTLAVIGLLLIAQTVKERQLLASIPAFPLRAAFAMSGAVIAFALLVRPAGLVPAIFALVAIATLGERPFRPVLAVLVGAAMSVICVLLFVYGLRVPLRPFWW